MTMFARALIVLVVALFASVQAGTNEEGLKFLAAKAKEEGVVTLESGLLYKGTITIGGYPPQCG